MGASFTRAAAALPFLSRRFDVVALRRGQVDDPKEENDDKPNQGKGTAA